MQNESITVSVGCYHLPLNERNMPPDAELGLLGTHPCDRCGARDQTPSPHPKGEENFGSGTASYECLPASGTPTFQDLPGNNVYLSGLTPIVDHPRLDEAWARPLCPLL